MERLEIEYFPVSDIQIYENNPRKNDKAVDIVIKSIKEYGWRVPIILGKGNTIIGGHTRLKAAIKMGLTEVPVVWADDLSEKQQKGLRIMDNKSVEYANWDIDLLKTELTDLKNAGFDLDLTGFSEVELSKFIDTNSEDNFEEPKEPKYKINKGDIYQLGNHRLMCGDCTIKDNVDKLMNGQKADMILTDPPYGNLIITNDKGEVGKSNLAKTTQYHKYKNEGDFSFEPIWNIIKDWKCQKVIWGGNYFANFLPITTSWIAWDKRAGEHSWFSDFELAWTNLGIPARLYSIVWQGMIRECESDKRVHPTQKPIELSKKILIEYNSGNNVLDLFGGSGSTLIACEQTNRKCYMMEIDEYYCSVIIERFEKLIGKQAIKLNN